MLPSFSCTKVRLSAGTVRTGDWEASVKAGILLNQQAPHGEGEGHTASHNHASNISPRDTSPASLHYLTNTDVDSRWGFTGYPLGPPQFAEKLIEATGEEMAELELESRYSFKDAHHPSRPSGHTWWGCNWNSRWNTKMGLDHEGPPSTSVPLAAWSPRTAGLRNG